MAFLSIYVQTRRQTIAADAGSSALSEESTEGPPSPKKGYERLTPLALLDRKDADHFHELDL